MSKKIEAKIIADSLSPHMKILNNDTYLLLIDEEAEIKQNNWYIDQSIENFNHIKPMTFSKWGTKPTNCFKILAYYPLTKEAKELDLPLLPNPFSEKVDVEKLAIEQSELNIDKKIKDSKARWFYQRGFVKGYKTAQSKQFSLEDMKKAIGIAKDSMGVDNCGESCYSNKTTDEIIQSLSTQQLPKEFVPEYENKCWCLKPMRGGCFDCTKILKTITNSEGKEELVGVWVFEK